MIYISEKPKSCFFGSLGHTPEVLMSPGGMFKDSICDKFYVACTTEYCRARGPLCHSAQGAVDQWNAVSTAMFALFKAQGIECEIAAKKRASKPKRTPLPVTQWERK